MKDRTFNEYIENIRTAEGKYKWSFERLEKLEKQLIKRKKIHMEMPYIVTVESDYYWLDEVDIILRETFRDKHGECEWEECEFSFDTWHIKTGLRASLNAKLSRREEDETDHIKDHFDMIEKRLDKPGNHSHKGIWTTFWIIKTGYDYGYQDFCFKYEVDWLKFLFMNFSFNRMEAHIEKENDDEK